jgi:hypothetical protein
VGVLEKSGIKESASITELEVISFPCGKNQSPENAKGGLNIHINT